jgi:dihydroorotase
MIRAAKKEKLSVTCDVGIHHVHLSDVDLGYFDSQCRIEPPLRSRRDREALSRALADGTIDCAVSDHTPVDEDQKQMPFGEAEPGATGLDCCFRLRSNGAKRGLSPRSRRPTREPARVRRCIRAIEAGAPGT